MGSILSASLAVGSRKTVLGPMEARLKKVRSQPLARWRGEKHPVIPAAGASIVLIQPPSPKGHVHMEGGTGGEQPRVTKSGLGGCPYGRRCNRYSLVSSASLLLSPSYLQIKPGHFLSRPFVA